MKIRHTFTMLGLLALVMAPALACNLPTPATPVFPTSPPQTHQALEWAPLASETRAVEASPSPEIPTPTQPAPTVEALNPFLGLQTATPGMGEPLPWSTPAPEALLPSFTYWTQPGDTLAVLAARFDVLPEEISAPQPLPVEGLLADGILLSIPNRLGELPYPSALLPDSLVVYAPTTASFDIEAYVSQAGGYLSIYTQPLGVNEWLSGAQIVRRVAVETSINPQVLLAFLEYRSGWVLGQPAAYSDLDHPIGYYVPDYAGLYLELSLVAKQLNLGYYGWRQGTQVEVVLLSGTRIRLSPGLNAGTAALQTLIARSTYQQADWQEALYGASGLAGLYTRMFGDPWQTAARYEPLLPAGLAQPALELPFAAGERWSLTAGPHTAWTSGTPRGAVDFAPVTNELPCVVSRAWATAAAAGLVVRAERGVVVIDLDGDGLEQTGWVLVYMHIAEQDRVAVGTWVQTDDPLGHPSCEGGAATGTHVHLVRKFNGEWVAANGPLSLVLSGWTAHAGEKRYEGTLEKDGQAVTAHPDGGYGSTIVR